MCICVYFVVWLGATVLRTNTSCRLGDHSWRHAGGLRVLPDIKLWSSRQIASILCTVSSTQLVSITSRPGSCSKFMDTYFWWFLLDTWCREFQLKLAWWKICIRLAGICTPISPAVGACFGHRVRKIVRPREQLQSCFQSQFSAEPCVTLWATFQKNYMHFKAGFDLDPTPFPHTPHLQPVSGGSSPSEVHFERQREGSSGTQKEKLVWGRAPNHRTQGTALHCRLQSPRHPPPRGVYIMRCEGKRWGRQGRRSFFWGDFEGLFWTY